MTLHFTRSLLAALLALAAAANAATVQVTTAVDENDAVGTIGTGLSLREALRDAPDGSDIIFSSALNGGTIVLNSEITVSKNVAVDASGLGSGLTIDAGPGTNRALFVSAGYTVGLKGLTVTGGGGNGNTFDAYGGAIYNEGSALTLTSCTLTGNFAPFGGVIYNDFGTLTLRRCTLTGNTSISGGALYSVGTLSVTHCTIAGNSASNFGGGIYAFGTLALTQSIVAGNTAPNGADIFNDGTIDRTGTNLVQFTQNALGGSVTGAAAINQPPLLAPLGNYGGSTKTMALLPGSPAVNAGSFLAGLTIDQRGFPTVGSPDIGAYEAGTFLNYNAFIWETLPATSTAPERAPTYDFDSDGVTNANEWIASTKPADSSNYLRVTHLARTNSHVTVTFPSVAGRNYSFESSTDLVSWTPIDGAPVAGTGNPLVIQLGPFSNAAKLFVRVRTGL